MKLKVILFTLCATSACWFSNTAYAQTVMTEVISFTLEDVKGRTTENKTTDTLKRNIVSTHRKYHWILDRETGWSCSEFCIETGFVHANLFGSDLDHLEQLVKFLIQIDLQLMHAA